MAPLPYSERAIVEFRKIEDYCLNPLHPRGRHKARIFREVLGIDREDSQWLRETILRAIQSTDALAIEADAFGRRWRVDIDITRHERVAMVRTIWIVLTGENVPRFVTCWVL